jgi:arsenate reductase-like glutaredoxin family protein
MEELNNNPEQNENLMDAVNDLGARFRTEEYKQQRAEELVGKDTEAVPPQKGIDPAVNQQEQQQQFDPRQWLVEASNGRVQDEDTLRKILSEYDEQKAAVTQQPQGGNPFAGDVAKRFNELVASGASHQQLMDFVKFQSPDFDPQAIDDRSALVEYFKMSEGVSEKDALEYIEEKYGDPETMSGTQIIELKREARNAKEFLQSQKIKASEVRDAGGMQQAQMQQRYEQAAKTWSPVLDTVAEQMTALPIKMSDGLLQLSAEGEEPMTFNWNIPKEFTPALKQALMQQAVHMPPTKESLQAIYQQAEQMIWAVYGPEIAKSMVKDIHAKTAEDYAKYYAGNDVRRTTPDEKGSGRANDKAIADYKKRRTQELLGRK